MLLYSVHVCTIEVLCFSSISEDSLCDNASLEVTSSEKIDNNNNNDNNNNVRYKLTLFLCDIDNTSVRQSCIQILEKRGETKEKERGREGGGEREMINSLQLSNLQYILCPSSQ